MGGIGLKYQVSVFGDFNNIDVNPENIYKLMDIFKDERLIPTTIQEFVINQNNSNPITVVRPRLTTVNNEWSIEISSNRIDVEQRSIDNSIFPEDKLEMFVRKSSNYISRILNAFTRKGSRLALNTNEIIKNISEHNENALRPNTGFDFFSTNEMVEWTSQSVARVDFQLNEDKNEKVNVVLALAKINNGVVINGYNIENGLAINFDINTMPNNTNFRFNDELIEKYFIEAIKKRNEIFNDVRRKIGVAE